MDPLYMNKIAATVHYYCVKHYSQPNTYTEDSVKFRQNV